MPFIKCGGTRTNEAMKNLVDKHKDWQISYRGSE
jgi:hypothetical protein